MSHWLHRAIIALLSAAAVVLTVALGAQLVGYRSLIVRGSSMGSAVPVGSLAFAELLDRGAVSDGDVILVRYNAATQPFIHRVMSHEEQGERIVVHTQGDANDVADPQPFILPNQVLRVAFNIPWLGRAVELCTSRLALVVLVAFVPALFVASLLWRRRGDEDSGEVPS